MAFHSKITFIGLIAVLWVAFTGCPGSNNTCASDFDQLSLLENVGDNIILPAYADLSATVTTLEIATQTFAAAPDVATLTDLRAAWKNAFLSWQAASIFEFGPAETADMRNSIGNFPVFTDRLNQAVESGSYDLSSNDYAYTRGFPALDYLLYGEDSTQILDLFTTDSLASNRLQYLQDVVVHIAQKTTTVYNGWQASGDNYINTFKTTTGTATGTPLSLLVNQINQHYELAKNDKIGIPVGAKTSYIPAVTKVEAYYSRISLDLAIAALEANQNLFLGVVSGVDGIGLDDYLAATNQSSGDDLLQELIKAQYISAITALENLRPQTLHDAILADVEVAKAIYAAAQNQVVYLKTDMPALLCVSITYIDNVDDGD